MHDEQYRIALDIPPMSAIFLKPKNIRDPEAENAKAKTKAEAKETVKSDDNADKKK